MKSLAMITEKDIETISMALNDSISDMNSELKGEVSVKQRADLMEYKSRYARVMAKLRQNPSIYSLNEGELDITAGGLNDAIQLIEENLSDDLDEQEREEILTYKSECMRLVEILAG